MDVHQLRGPWTREPAGPSQLILSLRSESSGDCFAVCGGPPPPQAQLITLTHNCVKTTQAARKIGSFAWNHWLSLDSESAGPNNLHGE